MRDELKKRLINVLEGIKEAIQKEEDQQIWYEYFCRALEELKKQN